MNPAPPVTSIRLLMKIVLPKLEQTALDEGIAL
jgi:hypothetical protein